MAQRASAAATQQRQGREHRDAGEAAEYVLVMMRDGAMAAGCLFDPTLVCETFLQGVEDLLR